jgi:hypothetical protein
MPHPGPAGVHVSVAKSAEAINVVFAPLPACPCRSRGSLSRAWFAAAVTAPIVVVLVPIVLFGWLWQLPAPTPETKLHKPDGDETSRSPGP